MTAFLASLAGIPPLGGWYAKFGVFNAVLTARSGWGYSIAVIGAINVVIATAYYVMIMREMWMKPAPDGDVTPVSVPGSIKAALAITGIATLVFVCAGVRATAASPKLRGPSVSDDVHAAIDVGGAISLTNTCACARRSTFLQRRGGAIGAATSSPLRGRPLFGAVLRADRAEFARLRGPTIRDRRVRAGRPLARSVLTAMPRWRHHYVAVEISDPQRERHPADVSSMPVMPPHVEFGVVVANELLDNLPFRLAVFDGEWREVVVVRGRGEELAEGTVPVSADWDWLPRRVPHGTRLPVQEQASAWVSSARRLLEEGSIIAFDYCTASTAALVGHSWRDWLRTYRSHGRGEHYLRNSGGQDITAQVCLDQLPAPFSVEPQAEFLRRCGIDELVDEGRRAWSAAAARPDLTALAMRSRIAEAPALLDRQGLGSFDVVTWRPIAPIRAVSEFFTGSHDQ
jgi:hypothetical protein